MVDLFLGTTSSILVTRKTEFAFYCTIFTYIFDTSSYSSSLDIMLTPRFPTVCPAPSTSIAFLCSTSSSLHLVGGLSIQHLPVRTSWYESKGFHCAMLVVTTPTKWLLLSANFHKYEAVKKCPKNNWKFWNQLLCALTRHKNYTKQINVSNEDDFILSLSTLQYRPVEAVLYTIKPNATPAAFLCFLLTCVPPKTFHPPDNPTF